MRRENLGEHYRRDEEGAGRKTTAASEHRDQRNEPEEELRREDFSEGDECTHRGCGGEYEGILPGRPTKKARQDEHDQDSLHHCLERRQQVRRASDEVLRPVARYHTDRGPCELVGPEQERRTESLDLEWSGRLADDAVREAVRC